jgi:4-hydroxy-tetrahydrodipicolinate reductase
MTLKVGMNGAMGRMGQVISRLLIANPDTELAAAIDTEGPSTGKDYGLVLGAEEIGLSLVTDIPEGLDAIIDFSSPEGTKKCLDSCVASGTALVIGTTGLNDGHKDQIEEAAGTIAVLQATNMSVGVNTLLKFLPEIAAALGDAYDVEIVETHHRFKKDAPSGTALTLAETIARGLDRNLDDDAVYGREGMVGERTVREIGVHAVRGGDLVGEHEVYFHGLGESIVVTHSARSRETFGRGAVRAAEELAKKEPGLYTMADVLFQG